MIAPEPFRTCPRFERCSVNCCPLDPCMHERNAKPDVGTDPEPRCTLPKRRRMDIAAGFPDLLPWRGLWPLELAAVQRWEAMPPEARARWAQQGRERMLARHKAGVTGESS